MKNIILLLLIWFINSQPTRRLHVHRKILQEKEKQKLSHEHMRTKKLNSQLEMKMGSESSRTSQSEAAPPKPADPPHAPIAPYAPLPPLPTLPPIPPYPPNPPNPSPAPLNYPPPQTDSQTSYPWQFNFANVQQLQGIQTSDMLGLMSNGMYRRRMATRNYRSIKK